MPDSDSDQYAESSRRFMTEAREDLEIGDFIQASGKAWRAAAYALKAVAEKRRWSHNDRSLLYDVCGQLSDEQANPRLRLHFATANALFQNHYENWMPDDTVEHFITGIELLVNELETIRQSPPPPIANETAAHHKRLARLAAQPETAAAETPE